MYESYEQLVFERSGPILTVRIHNPPLNTMNRELHGELTRVWGEIEQDEAAAVVILTGSGDAFSAGADLQQVRRRHENNDHADWVRGMREGRKFIENLMQFDKPLIAALNGHAIGLGATIALFCDIIVAADHIKIADTHVKIGLVAGDGGAMAWPQNIGMARAKEYLLTGRILTASHAAEMGLINYAVPRDRLMAKAMELAEEIAALPRLATVGTKAALNSVLRRNLMTMIDGHLGWETWSYLSEDHKEAVSAFLEKREPKFGG